MIYWRDPVQLCLCPKCGLDALRYLCVQDEAGSEYVARERCQNCGYEKVYDEAVKPESASNR